MKLSEWLGMGAKPKRGIIKKKPQRGKKHLVSEKDRNRLGEMFASMRQNKAPKTEMEVHEMRNDNIQREGLKRSDLMDKVERSPGNYCETGSANRFIMEGRECSPDLGVTHAP